MRHHEYPARIDNPLAMAGSYHMAKIWRETGGAPIPDLECAERPAGAPRLLALVGRAWSWICARPSRSMVVERR
jgi:hypothetical protein